MSANPTFVQALADATQRPVEVSPVIEATTLGAGFLAGLAVGHWERRSTTSPRRGGRGRRSSRARPSTASAGPRRVERASGWIPDLSALDF